MVVKVPAPREVTSQSMCGSEVTPVYEEHLGHRFLMIVCTRGDSVIDVHFAHEGNA
jgi:hypothetical protein